MSEAISLVELEAGQAGTVVGCGGGHGLMSRLAAMGFTLAPGFPYSTTTVAVPFSC